MKRQYPTKHLVFQHVAALFPSRGLLFNIEGSLRCQLAKITFPSAAPISRHRLGEGFVAGVLPHEKASAAMRRWISSIFCGRFLDVLFASTGRG
jgi:hypothetical protein